jgi:DNA-binding Lrp family transcriptional regulator
MESGHLRRIAAILHHRRAGFAANGMAVWFVPEAEIETFGSVAARHPEVTHCYQRPSYPDWLYNAFAMIHGRDRSKVEAVAQSISESCGIENPNMLYSSTEFKKVRLRYFTPDYDLWVERCEAAAHRESERVAKAGGGRR